MKKLTIEEVIDLLQTPHAFSGGVTIEYDNVDLVILPCEKPLNAEQAAGRMLFQANKAQEEIGILIEGFKVAEFNFDYPDNPLSITAMAGGRIELRRDLSERIVPILAKDITLEIISVEATGWSGWCTDTKLRKHTPLRNHTDGNDFEYDVIAEVNDVKNIIGWFDARYNSFIPKAGITKVTGKLIYREA